LQALGARHGNRLLLRHQNIALARLDKVCHAVEGARPCCAGRLAETGLIARFTVAKRVGNGAVRLAIPRGGGGDIPAKPHEEHLCVARRAKGAAHGLIIITRGNAFEIDGEEKPVTAAHTHGGAPAKPRFLFKLCIKGGVWRRALINRSAGAAVEKLIKQRRRLRRGINHPARGLLGRGAKAVIALQRRHQLCTALPVRPAVNLAQARLILPGLRLERRADRRLRVEEQEPLLVARILLQGEADAPQFALDLLRLAPLISPGAIGEGSKLALDLGADGRLLRLPRRSRCHEKNR